MPKPNLRALREADALRDAGWGVLFLSWIKATGLRQDTAPTPYPVRRIFVPVPPVGTSPFRRWRAYTRAANRLWSTARAEKPDLVVAHDFEVLRVGAALKRWNRIPLIYDAHEDYPSIAAENSVFEARIAARLERRWCRRVDHVVTVSEPLASKYRAWGRPATVLSNARSTREIQRADREAARRAFGYGPDDFVVGFTGVLAPRRGLAPLLEALAGMRPSVKALIVGGREEDAARLRARAAAMGVSARVRIDPQRPYGELAPYFAAMDLGVMLLEPRFARGLSGRPRTAAETLTLQTAGNLPNKLFDYMAHGVPVLVPDYPAMGGVVREIGCGWTVPEVSPGAIRAALDGILRSEDRGARAERGRSAYETRYAWDHQAPLFLRLARDLTSRR